MTDDAMSALQAVILCGGQGTRMQGETPTKKELVTVGGMPIIWHVMRIFAAHSVNRFVLTLGYGAEQIKRYFLDYEQFSRNLTVNLGTKGQSPYVNFLNEVDHVPMEVALIDTGLYTEKAGRIARVAEYLQGDRFFVAYGDDVSDVDLAALHRFHLSHGRLATITAVQIPLPYGVVEADESGMVHGFLERPLLEKWINGGFMLFERQVLEIMADGDDLNLESEVLPRLASEQQLMIYRHRGFWQSMNTMKDNLVLEELWLEGAPWKVW